MGIYRKKSFILISVTLFSSPLYAAHPTPSNSPSFEAVPPNPLPHKASPPHASFTEKNFVDCASVLLQAHYPQWKNAFETLKERRRYQKKLAPAIRNSLLLLGSWPNGVYGYMETMLVKSGAPLMGPSRPTPAQVQKPLPTLDALLIRMWRHPSADADANARSEALAGQPLENTDASYTDEYILRIRERALKDPTVLDTDKAYLFRANHSVEPLVAWFLSQPLGSVSQTAALREATRLFNGDPWTAIGALSHMFEMERATCQRPDNCWLANRMQPLLEGDNVDRVGRNYHFWSTLAGSLLGHGLIGKLGTYASEKNDPGDREANLLGIRIGESLQQRARFRSVESTCSR
jgi:hypothetical protein